MNSAIDGSTIFIGDLALAALSQQLGGLVSPQSSDVDDSVELDSDPRILVVEDDELVREFAVRLVKSLGYPVVSAADGMEAMRIIEDISSIDLLFTDIVMPGVDGIILADMVKQRRPALKILYTTGYRDIARAKSEAGILHGKILEKPYRPAELEAEIRRLLP
jgi:CheY-like chemotaxis protein